MTDQLTEVRVLTFEERRALARKAAVGDRWRKRKQHEHFCQVLANDGHGSLRLAHWSGRVTYKWYSYLASEYEPVPATEPDVSKEVCRARAPCDGLVEVAETDIHVVLQCPRCGGCVNVQKERIYPVAEVAA